MNIAIVGAGNVAWHLTTVLQAAGHTITSVYSRTAVHAQELAQRLNTTVPQQTLDFTSTKANIILIAVSDTAICEVAHEMQVADGTIVAHTSGSQPMSVLQSITGANIGVFYPLQTFSKQSPVDVSQTPILIEGSTEATIVQLEQLAQSISKQVVRVSSEKRKQLHLAAVFACNFTNHLLGISQELLQNAGLPTDLLQPLIQETIKKASTNDPYTVQTGPAIRNDQNVIEEHIKHLQNQPLMQDIYRLLTESIQAKRVSKDERP